MAVRINSDFAKEQKAWIKRALKGRPVYFGLQAQGAKKGKFLVSKKPGDVKPEKVKGLEVYEGDGKKDAEKAKDKNTIPGGASMGVCQGGDGTLTLMFERGKVAPAAERFVKFFVTREVKCKSLKKVTVAEVDQLPKVPDKDANDDLKPTAKSVETRVQALQERAKQAGSDASGITQRLQQALELGKKKPDEADDQLDELEFGIGALERAAELKKLYEKVAAAYGLPHPAVASAKKLIDGAAAKVKSGDFDGADDDLDVAEQSLANLGQGAKLAPAGGPPMPVAPEPTVDPQKAGRFFRDWLEGIKPGLKTLKDAKATDDLAAVSEPVKAVSSAVLKEDWNAAAEAYKRADSLLTAALKRVELAQARKALEKVDTEKLNEWGNNEYFSQTESQASKQALRNLERSPRGREISRNVVNLLNDAVTLNLNGPNAKKVLNAKKDEFKRLKDGFAKGIKLDEMISNRGNLVLSLDSRYGDPDFKGAVSEDQLFDPEVIAQRNMIKKQFFLDKPKIEDEPTALGRGRTTWSDSVAQQRMKQVLRALKEEDSTVDLVQAVSKTDQSTLEKIWHLAGEKPKKDEDQTKFLDGLKKLAQADPKLENPTWLELMGLDLEKGVKHQKGLYGKGFGLSEDPTDYFVETVRHGKNANVRLPQSLASGIFDRLRVPMVGGVSGTTVDFIGLLQDKMKKGGDKEVTLEKQKEREAVVAAFMFSMVGAGHHSLVEMIAGAQQWGYFADVPNPFSEIAQAATAKQILDKVKEEGGKKGGPQAPSFLDDGKTVNVTSYAGCLKAFEKYVRGIGLDTDDLLEWAVGRVESTDETFDVTTKKFEDEVSAQTDTRSEKELSQEESRLLVRLKSLNEQLAKATATDTQGDFMKKMMVDELNKQIRQAEQDLQRVQSSLKKKKKR